MTRTIIVSRNTGRRASPVYRVQYHDDGTVTAHWYGADDALVPFDPQPTPREIEMYLRRASLDPQGLLVEDDADV